MTLYLRFHARADDHGVPARTASEAYGPFARVAVDGDRLCVARAPGEDLVVARYSYHTDHWFLLPGRVAWSDDDAEVAWNGFAVEGGG